MQLLQEMYERLNRDNPDYKSLVDYEYDHLDCLLGCERHSPAMPLPAVQELGLQDDRDVGRVLDILRDQETLVYAMIAPAFISQFSRQVTPGKLRDAFKRIGFSGMIEVALFADILTLKEAFEFDRNILTDKDFMLTSCCCPMWISMIRKTYSQLVPHIPPSVSPMVACGRVIKQLCPGAKTVFIGPCLAKKAEAKEPDIADAVDVVLTFVETKALFDALRVDPETCTDDLKDHSSAAGRIYARVGGVSQAVLDTVNRIHPDRQIPLRAVQANGVPECKAALRGILQGEVSANFLEGMGCPGGCVGGPRRLIPTEEGIASVNHYGEKAVYQTPIDNPYVLKMLHQLGFDTVESLLADDGLFTRRLE